jgi:uncharacterized oxidoreductase
MGIGYALAETFLEAKNEVIICGRREKRLREAQEKHPDLHIKVCDVAEETDRTELLKWIAANFSALNILINNAGVQRDIDFTKGIAEYLAGENEIKINLEAPIILSGLFIPSLTGKKEAAIIPDAGLQRNKSRTACLFHGAQAPAFKIRDQSF